MKHYCCDEFKEECNKEFDPIEYRNVFYHKEGYVFTYEDQTVSPILKYCPFCGRPLSTVP
jgi:hypothetical protein